MGMGASGGLVVPENETISIPQGDSFKIFAQPTQLLISGPTKSGKTSLVTKILQNREVMFEPVAAKVYWFYTMLNSITPVQEALSDVEFIEGIPDYDFISTKIVDNTPKILVMDDMQDVISTAKGATDMTKIFTRLSHHSDVSLIFLVQDMYYNPKMRRITNQCENLIVMANGSGIMGQVGHFASQQGLNAQFVKDYCLQNVRDLSSHGYLLISNGANVGVDRVRTNILPGEENIIFVAKGTRTTKSYQQLKQHAAEGKGSSSSSSSSAEEHSERPGRGSLLEGHQGINHQAEQNYNQENGSA